MKRFSPVLCAVSLIVATTAFAASGPATKPVSAVLSGIAGQASPADTDTNGQCNVTPWVDVCPSGTCICAQVPTPKVMGNAGKGPLQASNFFVTIDQGINPATEPAVNGGPNPKCNLLFGVVTLTSPSNGQSETLNLLGTTCKHVIGISSVNPVGKHDRDLLSGGWGISGSPTPPSPNDESGWGTFVGSVNQTTSMLSMRISGDLSK